MAIEGYATATSVVPGGDIGFCLSSDQPGPVTCTVSRVGTLPVASSFTAVLSTQPLPAADAWAGFSWSVAQLFTVPPTWPTGLYQVTGQTGELALQFVVRPSHPGSSSRTLLQVCFITPQ